MPVGLPASLTPPASAVVAAVTGQPLELVRPLMESLESDVLPRDPHEAAAPVRHPPARLRARASTMRSPSGSARAAGGTVKVERTVEIAAPPEDVYDVVMDPARLEDWVTIHDHLVGNPPSPLEKGSS